MKVRALKFVEFAYGDKRRDKSKVRQILDEMNTDYDPVTDRYKKFRESLIAFEDGGKSEAEFLAFHKSVSSNKMVGYGILARNYLDLKEDHGLIWDGLQRAAAELGGLQVSTSWYLHTDTANQRRIVFLNFRTSPLSRREEKGLLTILQVASPESAGAGILNIQPATLVVASRIDTDELSYLEARARRFLEIANSI